MINRCIRGSVVALLFLIVKPALCQPETVNGYSVQHFTDENGLPQNSISDLLFDKDGYLWLASQVGLVRFNGSSFQLYYPDDKPVMESNIVALGKNAKGSLYFQTQDHHLYCHSGNNQLVSPINTPATRRPMLLNTHKQLFDFSRFLTTSHRNALFQRLFADPGNFFVVDTTHVYILDRDSLYYYDGELHLLSPSEGRGAQCFVYDRRLYVLHRDTLSAVYEGARKIGGNARIEGVEGRSYRLFSCGQVDHLLVDNRLYRLVPEGDGHLRSRFLVNLDFIPNISSVEYNAGLDLLLISTHTDGFYFLRRDHFHIESWPVAMQEQLALHRFGPMLLHKDKSIVTDKFIFTATGTITPVKGRGPIWQRCLFLDSHDEIWAARNNTPRKLTASMEPLAEWPPLDASVVDYAEENGRLYCLTGRSLWRLDQGVFRKLYTPDLKDENQQNESTVVAGPHRLWIATSTGLIEYDPEKGSARSIPDLAGAHVRAMHICRDSSILIGTYGEGYFYYFHQRFYRMPLDKNGFLITAHCFLEDGKGNIWIPCNKGLFKVPKADMDAWCAGGGHDQLYYYYYGRQDGLRTNEFNGGFNSCGVITPEGFVALLSMKGMVCFYTDSLGTDFPQGSIVISHLEVDGKTAPPADTVRLPSGYNNLVLEVSCPYLGNRNNLYLQYNLSGLNNEWKEVPADGVLNLSRLATGNYTLRIRKVNGFGKNNYQYRQWSLIVPPDFYRTPWFQTLVLLALLALTILAVRLRLKLIDKKKKLQQSEQALLRTNKQREKLISLVIHDLRSPLRFLTMLAGDLHDNQENLSLAELKERTYWVKKGAQDVYHFSEDFLLWVTSQKDNFKVSKQLFFVRPLLQEIYDFYHEQVLQKGNRLSYDADPDLQVWSDPHLIITIIRNLTDNANKYTHQGEIRIEARRDGKHLLVLVADTGRGMSPEQAAAFLGEGNMDNVKSGSQLGHKFIFDLTRRLDGTLSVESGDGSGTTVSLRIPLEPPA
jgi:signal transduction histidine kinase